MLCLQTMTEKAELLWWLKNTGDDKGPDVKDALKEVKYISSLWLEEKHNISKLIYLDGI